MQRNRLTSGIILSSHRYGEYHKSLDILSEDEGLFRAVAYGALKGKSRLSGVSEAFTEGSVYLYHDPVKDRYKVNEIDPLDSHEGLRNNLDRFYIASFWAEFVIKSFAGGGDFAALYKVLHGALTALEKTEEYDAVNVHFIWRYLALLGFRPDIWNCSECGAEFEQDEHAYFEEGSFVCHSCAPLDAGHGDVPCLSPWGRDFLYRSGRTPFTTLEEYLRQWDETDSERHELKELKETLLLLVRTLVERPLNTLSQGII